MEFDSLRAVHRCFTPVRSKTKGFILETITAVLIVLWLLGMVTAYTLGGLILILLVLAVVTILIRIIQGRRPLG